MPRKSLKDSCTEIGIRQEVFLEFVRHEWIRSSDDEDWGDEDFTRARLIFELQQDFGVNDEAVPIILHLLDQLHSIRADLSEHFRERKSA